MRLKQLVRSGISNSNRIDFIMIVMDLVSNDFGVLFTIGLDWCLIVLQRLQCIVVYCSVV
jgi:hypothetical protein